MDSLLFRLLCFLLLVAAAPRPNIAMPSDNPAERTQDSSSGKTNVTVYHCKDCEINACEKSNYEGCAKIGETQNEIFSNEKIHLVTSEKTITMCFRQEDTFLEGSYAIVWEKDVGLGDSCGTVIPKGTAGGNVIKICCAVHTDPSVPSAPLTCYPDMSGEKTTTSTADVIAEGNLDNPQQVIDEKSSIGIVTPLPILGFFAAVLVIAAALFVRRNRNRRGRVIVLRQSSDDEI